MTDQSFPPAEQAAPPAEQVALPAPSVEQAAPLAEQVAPSAPPAASEPETVVPLARLQGVQRELSSVQKAAVAAAAEATAQRTALEAQLGELQGKLADAQRTAAAALIAQIKATSTDIVPDMIVGDSPEAVQLSFEQSQKAYAAARSVYARSLPVSAPATTSQPTRSSALPPPATPFEALKAGLNASRKTINE